MAGFETGSSVKVIMQDGVAIHGWKLVAKVVKGKALAKNSRVVVYFHGNGGDRGFPSFRLHFLKQLLGLGRKLRTNIIVFAFDYRGFGDSDGVASSGQAIANDVRQLLKWTMNEFPQFPLTIIGHSLASGLILANLKFIIRQHLKGHIQNLIFLSPFTSIKELLPNYPILWHLLPQRLLVYLVSVTSKDLCFDNIKALQMIDGLPRTLSFLYIHGSKDFEICPLHSYHLFRSTIQGQRKNLLYQNKTLEDGSILYASKLGNVQFLEVSGAGHNSVHQASTTIESISEFIEFCDEHINK